MIHFRIRRNLIFSISRNQFSYWEIHASLCFYRTRKKFSLTGTSSCWLWSRAARWWCRTSWGRPKRTYACWASSCTRGGEWWETRGWSWTASWKQIVGHSRCQSPAELHTRPSGPDWTGLWCSALEPWRMNLQPSCCLLTTFFKYSDVWNIFLIINLSKK